MVRALKQLNWRAFAILLIAGLLGVLAVLPFTFDLVSTMAPDLTQPTLPMPLVIALAVVQNGLVLSVAIIIGLLLAPRVGLTMPIVDAWAGGRRVPAFAPIVVPAVSLGAAAGAMVVAVEVVFFLERLPPSIRSSFDIPLWKRLLSGVVYGGITEEILIRLFLLTSVVWLLRWWKTQSGEPAAGAYWTAIAVVSLIFGLGHLPVTSLMTPLTVPIVVRALVLNGIAGVAFGYLYWRRGLEAAMLAHMSAHLVMQGPGVMLISHAG